MPPQDNIYKVDRGAVESEWIVTNLFREWAKKGRETLHQRWLTLHVEELPPPPDGDDDATQLDAPDAATRATKDTSAGSSAAPSQRKKFEPKKIWSISPDQEDKSAGKKKKKKKIKTRYPPGPTPKAGAKRWDSKTHRKPDATVRRTAVTIILNSTLQQATRLLLQTSWEKI